MMRLRDASDSAFPTVVSVSAVPVQIGSASMRGPDAPYNLQAGALRSKLRVQLGLEQLCELPL
jgi:hypothetical protein